MQCAQNIKIHIKTAWTAWPHHSITLDYPKAEALLPRWLQDPVRVLVTVGKRDDTNRGNRATGSDHTNLPGDADIVSAAGASSAAVTQVVQVCAEHKKARKLIKFLATRWAAERKLRKMTQPGQHENNGRTIVFCNKIKTATFVADFLRRNNYPSVALFSAMRQEQVPDSDGSGQLGF